MKNTDQKLPEDFKKKWVEALRSGEYKQGYCALYSISKDAYCCLGVAGVVAGASNDIMNNGYFDLSDRPPDYPELLCQDRVRWKLMNMNDSEHKSFSEIADYIEENL